MKKWICICMAALMMCSLTACWSLKEEDRWAEDALYEHLESKLTEAVRREAEK